MSEGASSDLDLHRHLFEAGAAEGAAMVVLCHGAGGSAESVMRLGRVLAPDAPRLSVEGAVGEGADRRYFRKISEGVYDLQDLARRTEDLRRFVRAAALVYGGGSGRAIAVGYSAGASVLSQLICVDPGLFDCAVLLRPYVAWEARPADLSGGACLSARARGTRFAPRRKSPRSKTPSAEAARRSPR